MQAENGVHFCEERDDQVIIYNERETIGNILRHQLTLDPNIDVAGATCHHPTENKVHILVGLNKYRENNENLGINSNEAKIQKRVDVVDALLKSTDSLFDILTQIETSYRKLVPRQ